MVVKLVAHVHQELLDARNSRSLGSMRDFYALNISAHGRQMRASADDQICKQIPSDTSRKSTLKQDKPALNACIC